MPQISGEAIFMGLILGIALFILLIMLAAVVFIQHYEHRRNDRLTLKSLLGTITDLFPKVRKKKEAAPSPPDDTVIQTTPEAAPNEEFSSAQRVVKARRKGLSYIVSEAIGLISLIGGLINGTCVVLVAAPNYGEDSPYYGITQFIPSSLATFLFGSGFQFVLAALSGALLGAVIGWLATHVFKTPVGFVVKTGYAGGAGGVLSIGILFLNIYAS